MSASKPNLVVVNCHRLRTPLTPEQQRLSERAQELVSGLDESVRPKALIARFPRIVNKLAEIWRRPTLIDRYFDELLLDQRGDRQGFPLEILLELTTLKQHYQTAAFPMRIGIWDETNLTERFR